MGKQAKAVTTRSAETLIQKGVVLLDIWAPWCGWCRAIGPVIDEVAEAFHGRASVAKLNIDEHPEAEEKFQVETIPALLFYKDGLLKKRTGTIPKEEILQTLEELLRD